MKKIVIVFLFVIAALAVYLHFVFHADPDYTGLNFLHKYFAARISEKFEAKINSLPEDERAIVDYDILMNELNFLERDFAGRIFAINPDELGFKGPFYSREKPSNLVKVESVKVGERETGIQFCPEHSFADYEKMSEKMMNDIGRKLFIDSGYRSPGRQAYLFFYYLTTSSGYSLFENAKWIAMPGYSEHGHPINNAIDFTNTEGINGFSDNQTAADFEALPEYQWLQKNANDFNFYLSYPRGNDLGVEFEPWHWHWEKGID